MAVSLGASNLVGRRRTGNSSVCECNRNRDENFTKLSAIIVQSVLFVLVEKSASADNLHKIQ